MGGGVGVHECLCAAGGVEREVPEAPEALLMRW